MKYQIFFGDTIICICLFVSPLLPLQLWCLELFLLLNSLGTKWQLQMELFVVLQKTHVDAGDPGPFTVQYAGPIA